MGEPVKPISEEGAFPKGARHCSDGHATIIHRYDTPCPLCECPATVRDREAQRRSAFRAGFGYGSDDALGSEQDCGDHKPFDIENDAVVDAALGTAHAPGQSHSGAPEATKKEKELLQYASTLAQAMYEKNYRTISPDWKIEPDLIGILMQIDNMAAGIQQERDALREEIERLRGALEPFADDGTVPNYRVNSLGRMTVDDIKEVKLSHCRRAYEVLYPKSKDKTK